MHKKSLLGAAVCTLALMGMTTAPAFAQGQVERGTDHANSICSFSGLNDQDPLEPYPYVGRVQSYGQLVEKGFKDTEFAPSPSLLCNGHKFPYPEGFPEEPAP
jgi:hypothetical protein